MAVGLALKEGRIGEKRRRHRLQRQGHAHLLDHVRLGREVEVHLHRAGPVHHGFAHGADPVHVVGHQLVAPLGHHRHLLVRPDRRGAQTNETDTDLIRDRLHVLEMFVHLVAGLVDCLKRCARQLQLTAGL